MWDEDRDEYRYSLLFAAEVVEAATRTPRGEDRLKEQYLRELKVDWSWCDDKFDVELVAGLALRVTVDYIARRHALSVPSLAGRPRELWHNVDVRIGGLRRALVFAAGTAEDAWPHELGPVLEPWLRQRLEQLLEPPGQGECLAALQARVRHATSLALRYSAVRERLFTDRHSRSGSASWWCPDVDIAVYSPYHGLDRGDVQVPVYALRLDGSSERPHAGELTVVVSRTIPPRVYRFTATAGAVALPDDADTESRDATKSALAALGLDDVSPQAAPADA